MAVVLVEKMAEKKDHLWGSPRVATWVDLMVCKKAGQLVVCSAVTLVDERVFSSVGYSAAMLADKRALTLVACSAVTLAAC